MGLERLKIQSMFYSKVMAVLSPRFLPKIYSKIHAGFASELLDQPTISPLIILSFNSNDEVECCVQI
jgi:hypothetical protein